MCGFNDQAQEELKREQERREAIHAGEQQREESLHQGFAYDQGSFVMFQQQKTGPDSSMVYRDDTANILELGRRLKKKSYGDGKFFRRWKLKNSSEMKAIINATDTLTGLMSKPMDESTFSADLASVRETYAYLMQSCQTYISTHAPETTEGQLRLETVKQMEEQVKAELKELDGAAEHVLQQEGKHSWSEVMGGARTLKYRDGEKGCHVSIGGAGTSKVYILEGGPKKLFFKQKEPMVPAEFRAVMVAYNKKILKQKEDAKTDEERQEAERMGEALGDVYKILSATEPLDAMGKLIQFAQADKPFDTPESFRKFINPDEFHQNSIFTPLLESCRNPETQEYDLERFNSIVQVIKEVSKIANAADMAKQNAYVGTDMSGREYKAELTDRNALTSRIAESLGLGTLVAKSTLATVEIDGQTRTGMVMEEAQGREFAKVEKENDGKTASYSPAALRQLSNLYILDLLCGQVDRNLNNYFAQTKVEGQNITITGITGIDNDMAFGCIPFAEMKRGTFGRLKPPYDVSRNALTISSIDSELASRILLMNPSQLELMAADILCKEEIDALCSRLKGLQDMIRDAMKAEVEGDRKIFMFSEQDWTAFRDELERGDQEQQESFMASGYLEKTFMGNVLQQSQQ